MGFLGKISDAIGGLTGANAAKKQAKEAKKAAAKRTSASLGELTPEAMQAMMQQLYSKYMALLGPQMMFNQQALGANASRTGTLGGGLNRSLSAGLQGQMAQGALAKSIQPAMDIATQRAGIQAQQPIITNPARTGLTDLVDLATQFYTGGMMSTGSTQQQPRVF